MLLAGEEGEIKEGDASMAVSMEPSGGAEMKRDGERGNTSLHLRGNSPFKGLIRISPNETIISTFVPQALAHSLARSLTRSFCETLYLLCCPELFLFGDVRRR